MSMVAAEPGPTPSVPQALETEAETREAQARIRAAEARIRELEVELARYPKD